MSKPSDEPSRRTSTAAQTMVATDALVGSPGAAAIGLGLTSTASADDGGGAEPLGQLDSLPTIDPSTYEIEDEVGQGGIGRVLRARDNRLHRAVAIKELQDDSGVSAEDRFVREALLTARLQHPSIVPLYEAGRWPNGAPFYAMKLVTGRSLLDILSEHDTLEGRLGLLPHVLAAAEAIAYAHSEHIIHRDLKPANVLVGAFGETVVIDWGLAKDLSEPENPQLVSPHPNVEVIVPEPAPASEFVPSPSRQNGNGSPTPNERTPRSRTPSGNTPRQRTSSGDALTVQGAVIGTPAYMPPEQAKGRPVDERADVYSLGAVLYQVLTGACPYKGPTAALALRQALAGPPTPASERQPGIPEDLLAIVNKAMARDPADRYPTAKELADDLRRFQTGQIVGAHRYSKGELLQRFAKRYRAALSVGAVALFVLSVSGAISVWRILAESRLAREGQALAKENEARAVAHADDLTLVQAKSAVASDPNKALEWLSTLSPSFSRWPEARLIAADARAQGISTILKGHTGTVNGIAFSRDGKTLFSACDDKTIRLWDVADIGEKSAVTSRVFKGHTDEAWGVLESPDGATLLSVSKDPTLRIWNVRTGESRVITTGHTAGIPEVAFVGPDEVMTASDDGQAKIWNIKTGELRATIGEPGQLRTVTASPDHRLIAAGGYDKRVHLWDVATLEGRHFDEHKADVTGVAFSPDGKMIASRDKDGEVRLWDSDTAESRLLSPSISTNVFKLPPFGKLRFSPDGSLLAAAGDGAFVRLWDTKSGVERRLEGPEGKTNWLAFSPDGTLLAASSQDHTVRLWDLKLGVGRAFHGFDASVSVVAFSPDGAHLAGADAGGGVRVFPVSMSAGPTFDGGAPIMSMAVSPDGEHLASAGQNGIVRVFNLKTRKMVPLEGHADAVMVAQFSPDGKVLATGGNDGTTRLWTLDGRPLWTAQGRQAGTRSLVFSKDGQLILSPGKTPKDSPGLVQVIDASTGAVRELKGAPNAMFGALFSPDEKQVMGRGQKGALYLWSLENGKGRALTGHDNFVLSGAFSPDGKMLATGAFDHTLRLWDLTTGESQKVLAGGGGILNALFSKDGSTLFTCDIQDTRVSIWDVAARERKLLSGHLGLVKRFSVSPDEERLVTGSEDGIVRLWDLASTASRVMRGHRDAISDVAFSPDGKLVFSSSLDGALRVFPDDLPHDPEELRAWISKAR